MCSTTLSTKSRLRQLYPTKKELIFAYTPDRQADFAADTDTAFFNWHPTLAHVNSEYGKGTSEAWLIPQLADLSEFIGVRGKITEQQIRQLATMIVIKYGFLMLSEVMLLFFNFKMGEYGESFGSVNPTTILRAFPKFIERRNALRDERRQKEEQQKRESEKGSGMTIKQYCDSIGVTVEEFLARAANITTKVDEALKPKPEEEAAAHTESHAAPRQNHSLSS